MLATASTAGLGFAFLAGQGGSDTSTPGATDQAASAPTAVVASAEQARDEASRVPSRSEPGRELFAPGALKAAPRALAPAKPKEVAPVAGLNQTQMNNAKKIVETAKGMGLGKRARVIAIATAMQESNLYNLGNPRYKETIGLADGGRVGYDHDSVGLFQQRPASGWGTPANIMKPDYAARAFLSRLIKIPGWDQMALTRAAQAVQVSAYPNAYAKHEGNATVVVNALN